MNRSKLVFRIEEFNEYYEEMELSAVDQNLATINVWLTIPRDCYDELKDEWNDEKIEKFVRETLKDTFGARATVKDYDEPTIVADDTLPPAYHYTL